MLSVRYSRQFKKNYKKVERSDKYPARLREVVEKLKEGKPLDRSFNDHQLKGAYRDCRECHLTPDILLVYRVESNELVLVRTGSHSELFE